MSNRTQLREQLRRQIGDTTAPYQWADALLDDFLVESVPWYSQQWPRETTAFRDVAQGQRKFDLPPNTYSVIQVECPKGVILPVEAYSTEAAPNPGYGGDPGAIRGTLRQAWSVYGETLYLRNPASGPEVGASQLAMRITIPWDRLDPVEDWNGPDNDEMLLVAYAAVQAWLWLDGQDQRRGRSGRHGAQIKQANARLKDLLTTHRRTASSRTLDVVR